MYVYIYQWCQCYSWQHTTNVETCFGFWLWRYLTGLILSQGNNGGLWWGSNPRLPNYESDVQPTAPRRPLNMKDKNRIRHFKIWYRLIVPDFWTCQWEYRSSYNQIFFNRMHLISMLLAIVLFANSFYSNSQLSL